MSRRRQRLSRSKSRTMWLAWLAWGIVGSIFVFEDSAGGTGWLTLILTSPFWVMFAAWPFIWLWLKRLAAADGAMVEIDDDIPVPGIDAACRLVQKDGVRYAEAMSFERAFGIELPQAAAGERLAGGDEAFVRLDNIRPLARGNSTLRDWLAAVDSIASP